MCEGLRTVPLSMSCFKLNEDGTFQDASPCNISTFIDEKQAYCLCLPEVTKFIRETYGDIVCVMHSNPVVIKPSTYDTYHYVLG